MAITSLPREILAIPLADNDQTQETGRPVADGYRIDPGTGYCRFSIYRADRVSVTSSLWSGGDWHWRLTSPRGDILADCGGYRSEAECLTVIEALHAKAKSATIPLRH